MRTKKKGIKKIGFLMDPVACIHTEKDSSVALIEAALGRGYEVYYFELKDLFLQNQQLWVSLRQLDSWYHVIHKKTVKIQLLDFIFMRKDPPVNKDYLYATLLLNYAQKQGVHVINDPQALRDINEKLFIYRFAGCYPPSVISCDIKIIADFYKTHKDIILKPLDGMGGKNIFRIKPKDSNFNALVEILTHQGQRLIVAQQYLPAIAEGDKRIILMYGKPLPYAISRFPKTGESRANLATGGHYRPATLTPRDQAICKQVGPVLKKKGILFAGLDIIGSYLTEINITSPTCLKEIDKAFHIQSATYFFESLSL